MGKWGKYRKTFNQEWLKESALKGWLEATSEIDVLNGKQEAYCKLSRCYLRAHNSDLIQHSTSKKHQEQVRSLQRIENSVQPTMNDHGVYQISDKIKEVDMKVAVYVACHCSINSVDHLNTLLKNNGKGGSLQNVRLHRTKCTKLVKNVVAPEYQPELIGDIGQRPYALIVDEATDTTTNKFMGVCITYYSEIRRKMVVDFLGMIEVKSCTGEDLATALKAYLETIGLPQKNMNAIGTDGANNIAGAFNSFFKHLKKDVSLNSMNQAVVLSSGKFWSSLSSISPPAVLRLNTFIAEVVFILLK